MQRRDKLATKNFERIFPMQGIALNREFTQKRERNCGCLLRECTQHIASCASNGWQDFLCAQVTWVR